MPDGGRQVIDFPIPGDVIGLRSVLLRTSDHSFAAVTDVTVAEVSAAQMMDSVRAAAAAGRGVPVGRLARRGDGGRASGQYRQAQRTGPHRALPGRARAAAAAGRPGLADGYACPLNQYLLADALGLTAIHVNRILRQLRERGLLTFREARVDIQDLPRLRQLAGHHSGYLDQDNGVS